MLKDLAKLILTSKAAVDIIKEKAESKATECLIQLKQFTDKTQTNSSNGQNKCKLKEKAQEELFHLINEISHRAQTSEVEFKSFIKDKLADFTNNALLDSIELNDIRSEIAALRAEISELKSELQSTKR